MLMSDTFSAESLTLIIADLMTAMQTMKRKINVMQTEIYIKIINRWSQRIEIDCFCIRICQFKNWLCYLWLLFILNYWYHSVSSNVQCLLNNCWLIISHQFMLYLWDERWDVYFYLDYWSLLFNNCKWKSFFSST